MRTRSPAPRATSCGSQWSVAALAAEAGGAADRIESEFGPQAGPDRLARPGEELVLGVSVGEVERVAVALLLGRQEERRARLGHAGEPVEALVDPLALARLPGARVE